jgi:hypothetical protein
MDGFSEKDHREPKFTALKLERDICFIAFV